MKHPTRSLPKGCSTNVAKTHLAETSNRRLGAQGLPLATARCRSRPRFVEFWEHTSETTTMTNVAGDGGDFPVKDQESSVGYGGEFGDSKGHICSCCVVHAQSCSSEDKPSISHPIVSYGGVHKWRIPKWMVYNGQSY